MISDQYSPDLEMMAYRMNLGEEIDKVPLSRLPRNNDFDLDERVL